MTFYMYEDNMIHGKTYEDRQGTMVLFTSNPIKPVGRTGLKYRVILSKCFLAKITLHYLNQSMRSHKVYYSKLPDLTKELDRYSLISLPKKFVVVHVAVHSLYIII